MKTSILSSSASRFAAVAHLVLGLALSLALATSDSASAQSPVEEVQRGFQLIDDYVAMKDGADLTARIYSSSETRAILIVPADMATPAVILWPRTRQVESLKSMKVQSLDGGFAEVKKDAVAAVHPLFEVVGTHVVFDVGADTEMRIKPKPPLVGLFNAPDMLERSSVYAGRAKAYAPQKDIVEKLGLVTSKVRVRVFFGTWCPACGQMVPRILNVAEQLDESNLEFEFYGLPKSFAGNKEAKAYSVTSVPTGVIFVDDKEVGRITGNDWRNPESALWKQLGS